MKSKLIFLMMAFACHYTSYCQTQTTKSGTSVMTTFGGPLIFATAAISFETGIKNLPKLKFRGSLGIVKGVYYNGDNETPGAIFLAGDLVYLSNPGSNGFDLSGGLGFSLSQVNSEKNRGFRYSMWPSVFPKFNVGYRFYFGDTFFIKVGLGYPELNNFSLGWSF